MFDAGIHHVPISTRIQTQLNFGDGQVIVTTPRQKIDSYAALGFTHDQRSHAIGETIETIPEVNDQFDIVMTFSNRESIEFLISRLELQLELFDEVEDV